MSENQDIDISLNIDQDKEEKYLASGEVGRQSLLNTDKRLKIMRKMRSKFQSGRTRQKSINLSNWKQKGGITKVESIPVIETVVSDITKKDKQKEVINLIQFIFKGI